MPRQAERLAAAIRVLLRAFTIDEDRFPAAEGRMRYNAIDFQTIHYVAEHSGCKSIAVAAFLGVAPTTLQSTLDRLVERGLVERSKSAESPRAVALALSAEGRRVREAIQRQDADNCRRMLAAVPARERARFVEHMTQIAAAIGDRALP